MMETAAIQHDIATISRISAVPSILKVVAELTGMRVTMVARVTSDSWTACAVYDRMNFGLNIGDQLDVATTLCKEVHDTGKNIVIECATKDPHYCAHRTPKLYNIESYIAIPILRANGQFFGTLCAIDRDPVLIEPKVVASLTLFTELISRQLRAEEELQSMEQTLWDERKLSQLREQFIAVLGHDLRTPLGAIANSAEALLEEKLDPAVLPLIGGIRDSSRQMSRMIDDVLDFARGRLGAGLHLKKTKAADLAGKVRSVIAELIQIYPGRSVRFEAPAGVAATVDEVRFRQLISNLIGNALQHGPANEEVVVSLDKVGELVRLTFANGGPAIPAEVSAHLFEPFVRRATGKPSEGLGLGLYIASQIARAHGGSLQVDSADGRTVFTLILPP